MKDQLPLKWLCQELLKYNMKLRIGDRLKPRFNRVLVPLISYRCYTMNLFRKLIFLNAEGIHIQWPWCRRCFTFRFQCLVFIRFVDLVGLLMMIRNFIFNSWTYNLPRPHMDLLQWCRWGRISGKCRKVVQVSTVSILHYFIMVRVRGGLNKKLCRAWKM